MSVPDIKKFCVDLYDTLHSIAASHASEKPLSKDLIRAITILKAQCLKGAEAEEMFLAIEQWQDRVHA